MNEMLHDYVDGTLDDARRRELEARLASDPELRAELESLRAILAAAKELPESVEPPRDLWPEIEERLRRGRVIRFPGRVLLAAAAALVIFLAGLLAGNRRDETSTQHAEAPPTAAELLDRVEEEYTMASSDLFEKLEGRGDELDPVTVELIRRNLEIIDGAIQEIRLALEEDPENAGLHRLLTGEYRRRNALLRQAGSLADAI